jgi:hypothetical protein
METANTNPHIQPRLRIEPPPPEVKSFEDVILNVQEAFQRFWAIKKSANSRTRRGNALLCPCKSESRENPLQGEADNFYGAKRKRPPRLEQTA